MGEISITRLIAVAAMALAALAVWLFRKTGDPDPARDAGARAPHKPRTRYAEICAARREVERRMEDLRLSHRGSEFRSETLEHLRAIHAEIEVQLDAQRKLES